MTQQRNYRTAKQWQSIIDDFLSSDLSAPKFCEQHNLPYGSFAKWRLKLLPTATQPDTKTAASSFIDLSTLSPLDNQHDWNITLKLGNGVELVLSQS
jgi:putative transposase